MTAGASTASPHRRVALIALSTLLLLFAVLSARMLLGARRELARADAARAQSTAVDRHLRRAIAYYMPGNPWVHQAIRRLSFRAERAERRGKHRLALRRWRALRGAILALRGPGSPHSDALASANRGISRLLRRTESRAHTAESRAGAARRLRPEAPRMGWTILGLLGFLLWTGGASLLFFRGLGPDLAVLRGVAWPALSAIVGGLAAFAIGLGLA